MRKAPQTPLLHATKLSAEQIEGWAMPASSMSDGYLLPGSDSRKTSWNKKPFPRSLRIDNCVPHKAETGFPLTNKHWESPAHLQQHSIHPLAPRLYAAKSLDSLGYLARPQQENLSSPSSARGLNMANAEPGGISCETKASSIPPPHPPARRDSLGAARHHEMQPSLGMSAGRGAVLAVWSVGPVHKVTSGPVRPNEPQFAEAQAGLKMDAVALQAKEVQNNVPQPTMTIKSSPAGNVELKPVGHKDAFSHSASLSVYSPTKDGSADKDLYHSRTSGTCSPALLSTVVCRSAAQSTDSIGFYRGHGHLQGDACLDTNQASKENAPQNYVQSHDVTLLDLNLPNSEIPVGQLSNAVFLTEEEASDTQGKLICNAANVCFGNAEPHTRALHVPSGHSANLASKESYVDHMQRTPVKMSHQRQNEDILYEDTGRSLSLQTCLPETVSAKLLEIYTKAQRRRSSSDVSFSEQNNSHLDEGSKWIVPSSTCMSNKQQLGEQRSFSTDNVISAAETPILHHLTRGQTGRVYMQNDLTVHVSHHPTGRSHSADILLEEDGEHEDEVESTDGQDTQKYRESLKQAQGRVLRETSFRRNDLKIGLVRKGQTFITDSNQQERQKLWWNRQWSTSKQHEPKERKSVHPDTRVPSNMESTTQGYNSHFRSPRGQTLQRLHAAARQCSYSEPAKMHEVGRMSTGIMRPIPAQSRPQLKAVQQSALQRFLQRKTGRFHSEEVDENLSPASNHGQQLMNRQWEMEGEQRGNTRACMISCNMSSPEGAHSFASFPEKSHRAYVSEINLSSLPLDSLVGKRQQWLVAESGQGLKAKNNMSDAQTGSALQSANNRNRCGLSRESEKASSLEDLLERSSPACEYLHTRSSSSPSHCTIVEPPCDIATVSKKSVPCVSSHQYDKSLRERSASCNQNDPHMQSDLRYHQLNQLYKQRDIADKLCPDKRGHQNLTIHKMDTPLIIERVRLDNARPASDRLWGCRSAESLIEATSGPVRQNSFALSGSIKSQTIPTEGSVAAEDTLFPQYHHNKTLKCEHSNTPCTTNPTLCSTSKSPTQNDSGTEKHAAISSPQLQSLKNTQQPVFLAATASLEIPQRNLQAVPCTTTSRTQTDSQNNFSVSVSPTQPPRSSKVLSLHSCSSREDDDVFMDEPASCIALPDCLPAREDNFGKEMEIKGNKAEALPKNVGGEILDRNQSSPLNTRHDTALISESSMQSGQEHKLIQGQSEHSAQDVFMLDLLIKLTAADDSFTELLENEKSMIGILEMAAEIFPDYNEFCSLSMDSLPKGSIMQSYKIANDHASQDDSNKETTENLTSVKRELISNLTTHVKHLQGHKSQLQAQATEACMLGETLEKAVHQNCRSTDFDKYKQLMKDLDMVVNLLLSICGRLARVESAISCLPKSTEPSQKQGMSRKQLDLQGKLEDARELQRDLKIRETTMAGLLASSLSPSQLKDYHHLIGLKASVLITQRHLEESLQSAEFQLDVLHNSTSEEQATPNNL